MSKRKPEQALQGSAQKLRSSLNESTNVAGIGNDWLNPYPETIDSSFKSRNHNKAFRSTTITLHDDTLAEQLSLIDVRAAGYAKKGGFKRALHDCEKMIRIAPSRATGYLRAGELFSMYGYYNRATEAYKEGWWQVQDAKERQVLKDQGEIVRDLQQQRDVDVVGRLPYDILAKIIRYVSVTDVKTAINVSKAWENQLSGIPHIWSTTRIADAMDFKGPRELTYVSRVSHHIIHLEISYIPAFVAEQLFHQIINGNFIKLTRLTLHGSKIMRVDPLMVALGRVRGTLSNLSIEVDYTVNETHPTMPLGTVLSTCLNLKRLHYSHNKKFTISSHLIGSLNASFVSQLTDLSLSNFRFVDTPTITNLLRACPKLRFLRLGGSTIEPSTVQSMCPELELLCMDFGDFYVPPEETVKKVQGPVGIRKLGYFIKPSNVYDFVQVLNSNSHTLQELVVAFYGEADEMQDYLFTIAPLKKLRSLLILCKDITNDERILGLLEKAPGLSDLQFDEQCYIHPDIFDAILQLRRLKRLSFDCPNDGDLEPEDAPEFFRRIAQERIPIRSLSFSACDFVDDNVLDAIAGITSLQHIELLMIPNVTEEGVKRLFTSFQHHPSIYRIELVEVPAVTDTAIRLLHKVRTLQELHLNELENVTSSSVQGFDKNVDVVYWPHNNEP